MTKDFFTLNGPIEDAPSPLKDIGEQRKVFEEALNLLLEDYGMVVEPTQNNTGGMVSVRLRFVEGGTENLIMAQQAERHLQKLGIFAQKSEGRNIFKAGVLLHLQWDQKPESLPAIFTNAIEKTLDAVEQKLTPTPAPELKVWPIQERDRVSTGIVDKIIQEKTNPSPKSPSTER